MLFMKILHYLHMMEKFHLSIMINPYMIIMKGLIGQGVLVLLT